MAPDLDDTVVAPPRDLAVRPAVLADLDDTVVRSPGPPRLVEPPVPPTRPAVEADPVPSLPEEAVDTVRATIRMPDGRLLDLASPVLLGRRPSVPRLSVGMNAQLVSLPSPSKELSATHLELRLVGGAVVASDMLSTNGSVLALPGGVSRTLLRGESVVVPAGTLIDLGDGNVLEVFVARRKAAS